MRSYITTILVGLISVIGCSHSEPTKCELPKTYSSSNLPVTIKHSDNWKVYEFWGKNVAIEYLGLDNFERRYEAEIKLRFDSFDISEEDYHNAHIVALNSTAQLFRSMGAKITFKAEKKQTQEQFSNRTWNVVTTELDGEFEDEQFHAKDSYYSWYSKDSQITLAVTIRGDEFPELGSELDCIIKNIVIKK